MDSYAIHYRNKYPGGIVNESETSIDVYNASGNHCVALRKNGSGVWADHSERLGLPDRHDLSPIPKDSRVNKMHKDGTRGEDELASDRKNARNEFMRDGKVMSMAELKKEGYEFSEDGRVITRPAKQSESAPAPSFPTINSL
jgi:hypothetical protein